MSLPWKLAATLYRRRYKRVVAELGETWEIIAKLKDREDKHLENPYGNLSPCPRPCSECKRETHHFGEGGFVTIIRCKHCTATMTLEEYEELMYPDDITMGMPIDERDVLLDQCRPYISYIEGIAESTKTLPGISAAARLGASIDRFFVKQRRGTG